MKATDKPVNVGDAPIQEDLHEQMNALGKTLDEILNGEARGADRKRGFVLLVFPLGSDTTGGRCNYISNAKRAGIVTLLKEQIARFEGQPEMKGTA